MFYDTSSSTPGEWFLKSVADTPELETQYREWLDRFCSYEERKKHVSALQRILSRYAAANKEEDRAIEKALGWQKGDFTYHWIRYYSKPGCTSWLAAPDISPTGNTVVQKVRDYQGQNMLSVKIYRSAPDRFRVVTVGDLWHSGACAVMNEKGVVITQNDAPGTWEKNPRSVTFGSSYLLRYLAEHCATAAEALATLEKIYKSGFVRGGDLYFIADPAEGFVVESTSKSFVPARIGFGFDVRSNDFVLPGTVSIMQRERQAYLNGMNRRFSAVENLRNALKTKKHLEISDLIATSRLRDPEAEAAGMRQICMKDTISSMMFLPDAEYPEVLSTLFLALGPVRHTLFLPIPICLGKLPMELVNGSWAKRAFALREKIGLDHGRLEEFAALENKFIRGYFRCRTICRKLLAQNDRAGAEQLLEEFFFSCFKKARRFTDTLL